MLIKNFMLGQLETNCYIVADGKSLKCAVIDPGDESNTVLDYLESNHLNAEHILLTHGHFDHTGAVIAIAEETGADIWISEKDLALTKDEDGYKFFPGAKEVMLYKDGDRILCGDLTFEVIETPGHTKGSVILKCGEALFTGDTVFRESCGRTDLPGGSMEEMLASLRKIAALDGDYEIYPGHLEASTLSREREHNYYMTYALSQK